MPSELPSVNEVSFAEISKSAKRKGAYFERHLVDEKLSEVQKTLYLLKNGTRIQKRCALGGMPLLFQEYRAEAEKTIIPYFDNLWKESPESQILYARYIPNIFPVLTEEQMRIMYGVIKTMLSLKTPGIVAAWEEPLLLSIRYVPIDIIHDDLMQICLSKGSLSETETNRIYACKMFGAFSSRLDRHIIEDTFLGKAMLMCQDTAYGVRKEMAEQLPVIAKAIGLIKAKSVLSHELFQLTNDETKDVKQAAFISLIDLLEFFDSTFQKTDILPIFLRWVKHPPSDLLRLLISKFGEYLWKLSASCTDEATISAFCTFYLRASENHDPILREYCAYNFPGVLKSIGSKRFPTYLPKIFFNLCEDNSVNVRRRMASGFHQVANILGPGQACANLKDLFVQLLRDEDSETSAKVAANMHVIFQNFTEPTGTTKEELFFSLLPELIQYQQTISNYSWTRIESFFSNFKYFGDFFSKDNLIDVILPMIKAQLVHGSKPLKPMAAEAIVVITRKLQANSKQVEIFCFLIEELRYSKNYQYRMAFLDLCEFAMRYYSARFFYNNFVDQLITMYKDPVSNVRRRICFILPKVKTQLLLARRSSKYLNKINEAAESLLQDKDADVRAAAEHLNMDLMRVDKDRFKQSGRNSFSIEESADKKKDQEERSWGELDLSALKKRLGASGTNVSSQTANTTSTGSASTPSVGNPSLTQTGTQNGTKHGRRPTPTQTGTSSSATTRSRRNSTTSRQTTPATRKMKRTSSSSANVKR